MSELYQKSIQKLELDKILSMLAECADSDSAKDACINIRPINDAEDVEILLNETAAAFSLIIKKGRPSFSGNVDILASLERAELGGALQASELLRIAGVLRCARSTEEYITDKDDPGVLYQYFQMLEPNKHLEDRITKAIISDDEIADSASPALADIRKQIRIQSNRIKDSLQKIISSSAYSKFLQEPIITIRQGRYVVPVKSECKNDIPGLVHDVSATGSTLFIEPMSAVNANNSLRELEIQESAEIARILSELSAAVATCRENLVHNFRLLVQLDVIFAKARLAVKMDTCKPAVNNTGYIYLKKARHPLIDPKTVVPVDVYLGKDFDSMIITGPNTGGKTVTLKTLGLLTLMAECGLHIPAGDGSCVSTYDAILADIGDEQSITQSLSTFSSHMRTIVDVVHTCDSRTLVLFDELGAGTDPAEGAALAVALIEFCRNMGSHVVSTTHYAELKLYAMHTEGVVNASCEFDVETLRPTYKLLIGTPGKSNAFAIARKLGLPDHIIKEATDLVGKNDRDFDAALDLLEQQRHQMEKAKAEAEILRAETEKLKHQSEEYVRQIEAEKDKALEQARLQARTIIEDARRTAVAAEEEIKALKKQISESGDLNNINQRQSQLRRNLNDAESKLNAQKIQVERPQASRSIIVGDTVELIKLGTKANVLSINKDGSYELQAGILKITARENEIYLLEQENSYNKDRIRPAHSGRQMHVVSIPTEIDLRGMDSVEAICVMERFLDEALRANLPSVRIIHGKGTGTLRAAVQQSLKRNRFVKKFRLGVYGEGEDGVTIAELV